jgi:hypothetical protein
MALRDPVAVYNAATNAEAQLIRNLLVDAGIEAFAVEDVSQVGTWALGLIPEIHKPQVWVDRCNVEGARSFLVRYEQQSGEPRIAEAAELFCYECGEPVSPGASSCAACGKVLDWSEAAGDRGLEEPSKAEGGVSDPVPGGGRLETLRTLRKPLAWLFLTPLLLMVGLAFIALVWALFAAVFR